VVHGEHRGRIIGFPTANLAIAPERLLPANGVYAAIAHINRHTYTAVTNVGVRPTFENSLPYPRVEPYLLDTHEQFYRKTMTLEFIEYLRPEIKFPNSQALTEQIQNDIQRTKQILHYG
jgi:riboflavin kinase/FMN adenylyltransferase